LGSWKRGAPRPGHCAFAAYDGDLACELALLIPDLDRAGSRLTLCSRWHRKIPRLTSGRYSPLGVRFLAFSIDDTGSVHEGRVRYEQ
jgi:hypothetical protein